MAEFERRVIVLSEAAWRLRESAPDPTALPFALALFSDQDRLPPIDELARLLPRDIPPVAVIFRHDGMPPDEREALARRTCDIVRERGHMFLMARGELDGADGAHAAGAGQGTRTAPCHGIDELADVSSWADAAFLSPLFPTRSHPGRPPLTRREAISIAQASRLPLFGLGGMNEVTSRLLEGAPFQGFGAIEAFVSEPE